MSLNVKVGGVETDSFITVAEADAYLADLPDDDTAWNTLTVTEKELRLEMAAQLMGNLKWRGQRVYKNQGLCFPRSIQGYHATIHRHYIPEDIKKAQAFVAYSIIHRALENRPSSVTDEELEGRINQVSLGGLLTVSVAGSGTTSGSYLDKLVKDAQFPLYLIVKKWVIQVRGRMVRDPEDIYTSTTSTTSSSTSSSSSSSSTTA